MDHDKRKGETGHAGRCHCGTQAFAFGSAPDGTALVAVNVRALAAIDLAAPDIEHVDGAAA